LNRNECFAVFCIFIPGTSIAPKRQ